MKSSPKKEIHLKLIGSPPQMLIEPRGVNPDAWDEITIALGDEMPAPGKPLVVRPVKLVSQRRILQSILIRHSISLIPDEQSRNVLLRTVADDRAVGSAMENPAMTAVQAERLPPKTTRLSTQFVRPLRSFQERDLNRLTRLHHGANFSVPGAGKTTVTYALHDYERCRGRVSRLLVISPISAFDSWEEEAHAVFKPALSVHRWRGGIPPEADVILVNYQKLSSAAPSLASWMMREDVHLVVDEAHRAKKGAAGQWGRSILSLAPLAARRDILTGTPAPNQPKDLVSLIDILWPNRSSTIRLPPRALQPDPPSNAMAELNETIRPLYVRTTKEELKLPEVDFSVEVVEPGRIQRAIYEAMLNRYAGMFDLDRRDRAMFAQMGEVMMYLLQAASSPRLLSSAPDPGRAYRYPSLGIPRGTRLAELVDEYADHEVPPKIARACRIVWQNANVGSKTLIWSNFPGNLLDLERQLAALKPALIYGAIPSREDAPEGVRTRERELERFKYDDECKVLLANPGAMSEGVSLHKVCNNAIYIDRTFNAGQYLQSLDRIHRLGLKPNTTTHVTIMLCRGTIDERVDSRVADKTRALSQMLADPALVQMALPDDEDYGDPLDDLADLEEVLRHLSEQRTE